MKVAYFLKGYFESSGYNVILTRTSDVALAHTKKEDIYKRVKLINNKNTILYLSLHANSFPSNNVNGGQVFYSGSEENRNLAQKIQEYLKIVDNNKRQAKIIKDKYLLNNVNKTGCLIEVGFITGNIDSINLKKDKYLDEIAKYIYLGTLEYLSIKGEHYERNN